MRNGLYMFRHSKRLSQAEIAAKIGCSRATYSAVENGGRNGSLAFWRKVQAAFGLLDVEMLELMKEGV